MKNAILIVDDEEQAVKALRRALMDEDYEISSASDGAHALEILQSRTFKVIICDERMPRMSGHEVLSLVSLRYPETVSIMLTGHATIESAMMAVNQGHIFRFLVKPWSDVELKLAIRMAIERYDLTLENRRLLAGVRNQRQNLDRRKRGGDEAFSARDPDGRFRLTEMSEEEVARLLDECEMDSGE